MGNDQHIQRPINYSIRNYHGSNKQCGQFAHRIDGTGAFVGANTPTLITPNIGAATGTSLTTSSDLRTTSGNIFADGGYIVSGKATGGVAGLIAMYSPTSAKGFVQIRAIDNAGDFGLTIANRLFGQSTQINIPDPVAANANFGVLSGSLVSGNLPKLSGTLGVMIDSGIAASGIISTGASASLNSLTFSTTSGIIGTTTNDSAAAGSVGELVSSVVLFGGSPVSLSSGVDIDLTSISLTAGDWDVWGNATFYTGGGTTVVYEQVWLSATSATGPNAALLTSWYFSAAGSAIGTNGGAAPSQRFSLSTTTTIYISMNASFAVGTLQAVGGIYARRRR